MTMTTQEKKGIDVSVYQGIIDWEKVKNNIDFVIMRAGYGAGHIDKYFTRNADECARLGIPFGVYWFSYALSPEDARREADAVCDACDKYRLSYPVCFDFEYDSRDYAEKQGVKITKDLLVAIARAFLERVEERGYFATIYSGIDFLDAGLSEITGRYDLWLAQWKKLNNITEPGKPCGMWQYGNDGTVPGINGNVDVDIAYKDYPAIIADMKKDQEKEQDREYWEKLESIKNEKWELYYKLAQEVWKGKWGNGTERKIKLQEAGYDYGYVQTIVAAMGNFDRAMIDLDSILKGD